MALTAGSSLGPYEIIDLAGAGGMGEVYRAQDPRLGREVAVKVLPPGFAADSDRLHRFEQEARATAALNHPNILAVYDIGQYDGSPYIVSEFLDGHTLRARLRNREASSSSTQSANEHREALPVRKAIDYAVQIARGLAAAHDKGIVHRDLKPENVFITSDGRVKILDFGLAKLTQPDVVAAGSAGTFAGSAIPTESRDTTPGVVLGTIGYMSPEQVRGLPADHRSDIVAFGAVLYEMLSGQRAFRGDTSADTLTAILKEDPPDFSHPDRSIPPALVRIVDRCLEKNASARFRSADDLAFALDALSAHSGATAAIASPSAPNRERLAWTVVAVVVVAAAAALSLWRAPWRAALRPNPISLVADLGVDAVPAANMVAQGALSPDGSLFAFTAQRRGGARMLYLRRLDQLQATALAGTEGARGPFFSPDGGWIGFYADGKLKKSATTGGGPVTLADAPDDRGATFLDDQTIVFTASVTGKTGQPGLLRVSARGGKGETLTTLSEGEVTHRWPQALPGGRGILFTAHTGPTAFDGANIVVQPLPAGAPKVVQRGGYYGHYVQTGHLIYMQGGRLFAAPFDLDRLQTTGEGVPVVEGVRTSPNVGAPTLLDVAENGTLVYMRGSNVGLDVPMHWVEAGGKTTALRETAANWSNPSFDPSGRFLAIDISDGNQLDIWFYDWMRDVTTQFTYDPAEDTKPIWSPDGQRIVFASRRGGSAFNLYWQRANGSGPVQRLTQSPQNQFPASFHQNGKFLAFTEQGGQTGSDIMILPLDGNEESGWKPGTPKAFLNSAAVEVEPMFSPDGRFLAYQVVGSSGPDVYVRAFETGDGPWRVSDSGGTFPAWSTSEIFFGQPGLGRLIVVPFAADGNTFRRAGKPRVWSETPFMPLSRGRHFALHPDGRRFVVAIRPPSDEGGASVVITLDFFEKLRQVTASQR